MIIEPGVYRDKPTGAILMILGTTRLNGGPDDLNYLDMIDLVVLASGDVPGEWDDEGIFVRCMEDIFDDSRRIDGKIVFGTCLERIV